MLDVEAIQKILPHRYPFLLVDRVLELEPERRVVGLKNISANEPFFAGHFPGRPVMPGVLIVEALAQTAAVLMGDESGMIPMFMGIDKARFRSPVTPGDQLRLEAEVLRRRRNICRVAGRAFVGDTLVAEAEMMAALVPADSVT
ncbi:MAG: 3-hydroxyacyl-ACP dehydratase FabZ [Gemmatimonadota bacterium]|nr:3-hydroxyacyl-ACP dehydratase FabZ [Gemmatimonadota bacterium]